MQTRRAFCGTLSFGAMALAAGSSLLSTVGCISSSIYTKILQYVAVGLQAFDSVRNILIAAGVITPDVGGALGLAITLVKAGFADLQTAVNDYNAAPADQKATLLGRIATVLAVLQTRLSTFWADLTIPDPKLAALIQGLIGVIVTTLAGFATQLPAPAAAPKLHAKLQTAPVKRSVKQFKADFNTVLAGSGYTQYMLR